MHEQDLPRPTVTVATIVERDGRFLVVEEQTRNGMRLNQPAGHLEVGESLPAAAIRETLEETGYRIHTPELIGRFFVSPGGTSERVFLYFAEVGDADRVSEGGARRVVERDVVQAGDAVGLRAAAGRLPGVEA